MDRPDGGPPPGWSHELLSGIERPRSHTLSPDGTRIAFFWEREDAADLYVMPAVGGWPARLTFGRGPRPYWFDEPPQWSPDGEWLAYNQDDHAWIVPARGGTPRKLSGFTTAAGSPRWLPDSQGVILSYDLDPNTRGANTSDSSIKDTITHLLLTDLQGSWPRVLTPPTGRDSDPRPSPDGRFVVYVHKPLDDLGRTDIHLVELSSGSISPLIATPGRFNRSPRWSPDSQSLAFCAQRQDYYDLYLYDLQGGREHLLSRLGCDLDEPCWSPDGRRIACTANRDGAFDLLLVEIGSSAVQELRAANGFHTRPQWTPDGRSITFEYDDPATPADIYCIDVKTHQITQLTFSTPPALARLELPRPEAVRFPSLDGLEIPGFLFRGAGIGEKGQGDEGKRDKGKGIRGKGGRGLGRLGTMSGAGAGIVYPHGGPTAQYALEWDPWAQYMLAKGYTILAPNYRGSTGYGLSFERGNYNSWGEGDTGDCLAAADFLSALEGIDRQRLAIYGGSYGGYMVTCCLAFDPQHRFACGVAKYGDCDMFTSWAQCEYTGREDLYRMMGHPATNRQGYQAASPITHAADIQAPVLIVHGLQDPYVPPMQSEELVEALRREDKTYEYVTYPDEGHGILRRVNLLDFYARMERFLDWYLL
jgi:dipeptidyl aminopeptidase/acylaminoacyl peptidase